MFGFVRTAATKLPIPRGKDALDPDLFPADITCKLYSFTGRGRKVRKMIELAGIVAFGLTELTCVLYVTYRAGDSWFAWSTMPVWLTLVIHGLVLLAVTLPLVVRAHRHANKYKGYALAA